MIILDVSLWRYLAGPAYKRTTITLNENYKNFPPVTPTTPPAVSTEYIKSSVVAALNLLPKIECCGIWPNKIIFESNGQVIKGEPGHSSSGKNSILISKEQLQEADPTLNNIAEFHPADFALSKSNLFLIFNIKVDIYTYHPKTYIFDFLAQKITYVIDNEDPGYYGFDGFSPDEKYLKLYGSTCPCGGSTRIIDLKKDKIIFETGYSKWSPAGYESTLFSNPLENEFNLPFDPAGTRSIHILNIKADLTSDKLLLKGSTTTSSLSGTSGTNGWYTSNVTVTLSATDNAGGTGALETKYSTDNGANWNLYSSPFVISSEGTTTLKYYSQDKIGNVEATNTQTIKIDKTAPEAKISFDTANGFPKIEGVDNLSATTVTKVDDSNYTITDNSGRTLKINLLAIQTAPTLSNPAVLTMKINSLQYDSSPAITLPITTLVYKWLGSPLTLLTQNVTSLLQFVVTGVYNPVNNTTTIVAIQGGVPATQTLSGAIIIKLTTNAGMLGFGY